MSAQTLDALNQLLAHEISAADIYDACLADIPPSWAVPISTCQDSHVQRTVWLRQAIGDRGGTPIARADFWGSVTAALMASERQRGIEAILALLLIGEEEADAAYRTALAQVDAATAAWLQTACLPEHQRTGDVLRALRSDAAR